jgi:CubicO group peptidase (beta-lactamase class C family)
VCRKSGAPGLFLRQDAPLLIGARRIWTRGETHDGETTGYGLGWQIGEEQGLETVGHVGAQQGTTTHLLICPERGFAVVVLCNLERARPRELTSAIAEIFLVDEAD